MSRNLLLLVYYTLSLPACDSPGRGGSCDFSPSSPLCQPSAPNDTTSDSSLPDTSQTDIAQDSTPQDTPPADASMADTTALDTTTPPIDSTQFDTGSMDTAPSEDSVQPLLHDKCLGQDDLQVICSRSQDPANKAGACGTSNACIGLALQSKFLEFEDCIRRCMLDAERPNFEFVVSEGCTDCYVDFTRCSAEHCLGQCASNPSSTGCTTCRVDNSCTSEFAQCTGDTTAACSQSRP